MRSLSAFAVLLALWPASATAVDYTAVQTDRASYSRVIHLYGDSISRGFGLARFADTVDSSDPMYSLRSVASMIDLVFADNDIYDAATYAGNLFTVGTWDANTDQLADAWDNGTIRVGDVLVFEDAGDAPFDPDVYEDQFWSGRQAVTAEHPVTLLMLDMFDYPPAPPDSQYGLQLTGSLSGLLRSRGAAVRSAAQTPMPYVGQTLLVPLRTTMDSARASAQVVDGVPLIQPDGIHPNVWGQMLIAGEILKAAGYRPQIKSLASVQAVVAQNYVALGYGGHGYAGQGWTASRASDYVTWLLKR